MFGDAVRVKDILRVAVMIALAFFQAVVESSHLGGE
jgi:hypothetical protein